ncbi:MAG: hypothetical protein Q7S37_00345 [bacterium]|nr:hypothetical protein [bacterium]
MATKVNLREAPSLKHLQALTTRKGLYQHCRFNEPDKKFGYSIDDNARAILVAYQYYERFRNPEVLDMAQIYLNYISRAQTPSGFFHNFASSSGKFIDVLGSQDSQGRTIWALGYIISRQNVNPELAKKALKILGNFRFDLRMARHDRTKAFALLGYCYIGDREKVKRIADKLVEKFKSQETNSWNWFEDYLTYSNAILPYSLLMAFELSGIETYKKVALKSLKFLHQKCIVKGIPAPIGQDGWYRKGKKKAIYDQQVVDVADMILAHTKAFELTGEQVYLHWAQMWWSWFGGNNLNDMSLIDPETHGCYDGLTHNGINLNQGAESIVCYLLSYLAMSKVNTNLEIQTSK